jgi:hypothetical protein
MKIALVESINSLWNVIGFLLFDKRLTLSRLAGKVTVAYVMDQKENKPRVPENRIEKPREMVNKPIEAFSFGKNLTVGLALSPMYSFGFSDLVSMIYISRTQKPSMRRHRS